MPRNPSFPAMAATGLFGPVPESWGVGPNQSLLSVGAQSCPHSHWDTQPPIVPVGEQKTAPNVRCEANRTGNAPLEPAVRPPSGKGRALNLVSIRWKTTA